MCGIFASTNPMQVMYMLQAMKYRGPDAQRIVSRAGFHVGFARLAIVDTDSAEATQPYHSVLHNRVIAFNGEIYNYRDLCPGIKSEVSLLNCMLAERLDPRQFIDGDYAILDHEPSVHRVTLYRDRFGVCPLYFQLHPFAVSSEARFLKRPLEVKPHEKVVLEYSRGHARILARETMKHYGVCQGGIDLDRFEELFLEAVRSRATHTDSGFSVTCSGGLDSTAVVLALRRLNLIPEALLCATFGDDTEDVQFARMIAEQCGRWPLKVLQVTKSEVLKDRADILRHADVKDLTGMGWRVAIRNWYVAKASPTRVILSGEGSDELFSGYPPHPERLKVPLLIAAKQLGALRSLPFCSLNLSNKIGLAHSREFRAPFLHSMLSYTLLGSNTGPNKQLLRDLLRRWSAPEELVQRSKWGANEERLDKVAL